MKAHAFGLLRAAAIVAALSSMTAACESTPPAASPPAVAAGGAQPASPAAPPEQSEGSEHRQHHHGGVVALVAMSIHDLDLSADQKAAVEKIRTDLVAKMDPARSAEQSLANVLADGVAAGAVDRAKVDAAIDQVVAQTQAVRGNTLDAMNQLHAALTPAQRAALVGKLQEHFDKWKEANGHEDQEGQHRSGYVLALVRDLSLSRAEAQQIKDSFRNLLQTSAPANGQADVRDHQHKAAADQVQAFATAFKADSFDAHSLADANAADGRMARWGATRMARFFEAAAPVLTPDQRTKLSQMIRDRANRRPT